MTSSQPGLPISRLHTMRDNKSLFLPATVTFSLLTAKSISNRSTIFIPRYFLLLASTQNTQVFEIKPDIKTEKLDTLLIFRKVNFKVMHNQIMLTQLLYLIFVQHIKNESKGKVVCYAQLILGIMGITSKSLV